MAIKMTGMLPNGFVIDGKVHKEFEIRAPLIDDMVNAEMDADARKIHTFNVALLSQVLIRVGDFDGAITPNMIRRLKRSDYNVLVNALLEVEDKGEDQSGVAVTSTAAS